MSGQNQVSQSRRSSVANKVLDLSNQYPV